MTNTTGGTFDAPTQNKITYNNYILYTRDTYMYRHIYFICNGPITNPDGFKAGGWH